MLHEQSKLSSVLFCWILRGKSSMEEDGVRDRGREEEKGGEGKRGKGKGKRDCNIN